MESYIDFPGDPEDEDGVTQVWTESEKLIRELDVVAFIGYSLPQYDAPAREFFQRTTSGKAVEVYNLFCTKEALLRSRKSA